MNKKNILRLTGLVTATLVYGISSAQQLNLSERDALERWKSIALDTEAFKEVYDLAVRSGNPTEARNVKTSLAWFETFETFEWERAKSYMRDDYIQHAFFIDNGRDGLIDLLACCWPPGAEPGAEPEPMNMTWGTNRIIADDDYVLVQRVRMVTRDPDVGPVPQMQADVMRFDDQGLAAEHWNLSSPGYLETVSGRQVYDDAAQYAEPVLTSDTTEAFNKSVVYDFLTMAFGKKQYAEAAEAYLSDEYIQHNAFVDDGADAFVDFFESGVLSVVYDVHFMLAQNDIVAVYATQWHKSADADDWELLQALDLFRVRGSKIVEHWDYAAPLSPPEGFVHINGDF